MLCASQTGLTSFLSPAFAFLPSTSHVPLAATPALQLNWRTWSGPLCFRPRMFCRCASPAVPSLLSIWQAPCSPETVRSGSRTASHPDSHRPVAASKRHSHIIVFKKTTRHLVIKIKTKHENVNRSDAPIPFLGRPFCPGPLPVSHGAPVERSERERHDVTVPRYLLVQEIKKSACLLINAWPNNSHTFACSVTQGARPRALTTVLAFTKQNTRIAAASAAITSMPATDDAC